MKHRGREASGSGSTPDILAINAVVIGAVFETVSRNRNCNWEFESPRRFYTIKQNEVIKMKIFLEIFAAEGGDDAKLLVDNHVSAYVKACNRNCL